MSKQHSLLKVEHLPGMTVAHIPQRLLIAGGEIGPVAQRLMSVTETSAAERIVLDLSEVSALSSLALAVLIQLFRRLEEEGRGLTFSRVRPELMEVFLICRLTTLLDVRGCAVPLTLPGPEPHEAAFLDDIVSSPDEDAPRLIFADWLEDRGRPGDAERAEFIRLQCAPGERGAREQELLTTHGDAWAAPLNAFLHGWEFRQGFIEEVSLSAGAFLDHATDLFRRAPARRVRLTALRGFLPLLSRCPHLSRVRELSIDRGATPAEGIDVLIRSPHLAGTKLELIDRAAPPAGDIPDPKPE
jgi:anti-anti-sigma factor